MTVEYSKGYAYFKGYKFRKDSDTGYYLSTRKIDGTRKRLHVYVAESFYGAIPQGYHVHHKDENKDNNSEENLMVMTKKEHFKWHGDNMSEEIKKASKRQLDKVRHKAKEWHGSEEGKKWHSEQAKRYWSKNVLYDGICKQCGKKYKAKKNGAKYCTPNCRQQARRDSGVDKESRECFICGAEYKVNRYSKSKTCSIECRGKLKSLNSNR